MLLDQAQDVQDAYEITIRVWEEQVSFEVTTQCWSKPMINENVMVTIVRKNFLKRLLTSLKPTMLSD